MAELPKSPGKPALERWIERLIPFLALGLAAVLLKPFVGRNTWELRLERARADVRAIHDAALQYREHDGVVPTIDDLTTPDESGNAFLEMEMIDPWGNGYEIFHYQGTEHFETLSLGPDGYVDSDDDLWLSTRDDASGN